MNSNHVVFTSPETYHAYRWVSAALNINDVLEEAYRETENDEWFHLGDAVSSVMRDSLAILLEAKVSDALVGLYEVPESPWEAGIDATVESFAMPLLASALSAVNWYDVAEAILRDRGKWAPYGFNDVSFS